ncbi:MAG TPA: hypothetical protein VMU89_01545 [Thermomicrobiaceae bacterium]|nr:hypothetical protein [Thermomicrobiaceae bacterium]
MLARQPGEAGRGEEQLPTMRVQQQTPMRCPICERDLDDVRIRDIGSVTAHLLWQMHAGRCPEHGWFQAEVISKPPREIFPVNRPGGVARRVLVDGQLVFAFPTVWNAMDSRQKVDPLDPLYWKVDWELMRINPGTTRV